MGSGELSPDAAPQAVALRVLYEDEYVVAIDKPAGLLVHPSALDAHEPVDAWTLLQAQRQERLHTVHRLDKGTSGVLLFARHADAARAFGAAFESGLIRKRYFALVRGWPVSEGLIDASLARDPEAPSAGQPRLAAQTRFRVVQAHEWPFGDGRFARSRYATVEVEPLTGRRHQIRRHFKHIAHPLIGDTTHGKAAHNRAVAQWLGCSRLWLHAAWIEWPGMPGAGQGAEVRAPLGAEWQALLPGDAQSVWEGSGSGAEYTGST